MEPDKLTIVLLADRSTHENMGRVMHALLYAKQALTADLDVELVFDGGGVEWAADLPNNENFKDMYAELVDQKVVAGACTFCAGAFGVSDELEKLGANMLDEDSGHPDVGKRIAAGRQILAL